MRVFLNNLAPRGSDGLPAEVDISGSPASDTYEPHVQFDISPLSSNLESFGMNLSVDDARRIGLALLNAADEADKR